MCPDCPVHRGVNPLLSAPEGRRSLAGSRRAFCRRVTSYVWCQSWGGARGVLLRSACRALTRLSSGLPARVAGPPRYGADLVPVSLDYDLCERSIFHMLKESPWLLSTRTQVTSPYFCPSPQSRGASASASVVGGWRGARLVCWRRRERHGTSFTEHPVAHSLSSLSANQAGKGDLRSRPVGSGNLRGGEAFRTFLRARGRGGSRAWPASGAACWLCPLLHPRQQRGRGRRAGGAGALGSYTGSQPGSPGNHAARLFPRTVPLRAWSGRERQPPFPNSVATLCLPRPPP